MSPPHCCVSPGPEAPGTPLKPSCPPPLPPTAGCRSRWRCAAPSHCRLCSCPVPPTARHCPAGCAPASHWGTLWPSGRSASASCSWAFSAPTWPSPLMPCACAPPPVLRLSPHSSHPARLLAECTPPCPSSALGVPVLRAGPPTSLPRAGWASLQDSCASKEMGSLTAARTGLAGDPLPTTHPSPVPSSPPEAPPRGAPVPAVLLLRALHLLLPYLPRFAEEPL